MVYVFSHGVLQGLYEAARSVLDEGKSPEELRDALEELEKMAGFRESPRGQEILEQARELYSHPYGDIEDIEVDDGTYVYHNGSHGYWVMGWCFVPEPEDENDEDEEDGDQPIHTGDNPPTAKVE
jgi:hypothetical protein